MIGFAPTIARLRAAGFASVDGVLEFAGLSEAPRASPALFLVPESESAAANRMAGVVDQKVTERFAVVLVVATARATRTVSEALQQHGKAIEEALVGWVHPDASGPCEMAGARLLSTEGQRVAWAISFSVSRHIRRQSQ